MSRQFDTSAVSLGARAAMRVTQLTKISGLSFTLLLALGNPAFASPTAGSLSAEFDSINTCLLKAMEAEEPAKAEGRTQGTEILSKEIDTCLSPFLDFVTDDLKVTMNLENMAFSNQVKMTGSFAFAPSAIEDGVVEAAELISFQAAISASQNNSTFSAGVDLTGAACSLSSMKTFSYTPSASYAALIRLRSLSKVASNVANQGQADASTKSLIANLGALEAQLLTTDESPSRIELRNGDYIKSSDAKI